MLSGIQNAGVAERPFSTSLNCFDEMQMNFPVSARTLEKRQLGQSTSHTRDKPDRGFPPIDGQFGSYSGPEVLFWEVSRDQSLHELSAPRPRRS